MSGMGDSILCDLIAAVIVKSVRIIRLIVQDSRNFLNDRQNFQVRLNIQTARLEEVQKLLFNRVLSEDIQPRDRHTYYHVMQKLYRSLVAYVLATDPQPSTKRLLEENSAEALFKKLERQDPMLLNPSRAQEKFWLGAKERVTWVLFKKEKLEKLVVGVEEWGKLLDELISATIPLIFIRKQLTATEIAKNTPGDGLTGTNIKSQILIEKRLEDEVLSSSMSGLELTPLSADLHYSQLRFFGQHAHCIKTMKDGDEKDEGRTDLGGASRRQWAQLVDDQGRVQENRIIVEFKERSPPRDPMSDRVDSVKKELRSLVRILRIASKEFQVLNCHGFYETSDHYGLVYQLPKWIAADDFLQCESLGNILMHERYSPLLANNLDNRLVLARALATTMYHLHSVQWVHKSFNPDNILLFGRKAANGGVEFDWSRPYVVGFDASRANLGHSDKLPTSLRWENRVYTHPDRQREGNLPRFHKIYDLYSLGVVLLELGLLKCFKHSTYRRSPEWTDIPASEVQRKFVICSKELRSVLGKTYAEIVEVCLSGDFGMAPNEDDQDETKLLMAFRSEVCEKFDQVRY